MEDYLTPLEWFSRWDPSILTGDIPRIGAQSGYLDLMHLALATVCVDMDARSSGNQTALVMARIANAWTFRTRYSYSPGGSAAEARGTHRQICEAFLAYSADPNLHDGHGLTALHYTVKYRHLNPAEALLKAGADAHAMTNSKESLLCRPGSHRGEGRRSAVSYAGRTRCEAVHTCKAGQRRARPPVRDRGRSGVGGGPPRAVQCVATGDHSCMTTASLRRLYLHAYELWSQLFAPQAP